MIKAIAIDDEPLALDLIETYCSGIDYIDLKRKFTNTSEAALYLYKFSVDLLFLDIQMPDISGIDFYKTLDCNILVIFTTAYSEYAVAGFNLDAMDYLLKPINFKRFEKAVRKTRDYLEYVHHYSHEDDQSLFVRSDYKLCRIPVMEIRYIEGMDNYVKIYTGDPRPVISHITIKELCTRLPRNSFIRVHRSFVINIKKNISYSNKYIYLGEKKIPVGISYEDDVRNLFR